MTLKRQLALLVAVMVPVFGVLANAQTNKPRGTKPRVFFVEPKNNATVTSPVHMKFGSTGIEIGAVPAGDVKTARPGIAHYHVGIDVPCLPAGQTIVKGTPQWVHFGDGKSEFDSQLTPGKHKLALQLGDDLHNTLPGTCTVIAVTVK
jgi:hypothetical protein